MGWTRAVGRTLLSMPLWTVGGIIGGGITGAINGGWEGAKKGAFLGGSAGFLGGALLSLVMTSFVLDQAIASALFGVAGAPVQR